MIKTSILSCCDVDDISGGRDSEVDYSNSKTQNDEAALCRSELTGSLPSFLQQASRPSLLTFEKE